MTQIVQSRSAAIDAKCRDCTPHDRASAGSWRDQIAACTIRDCPLYRYRPVPRACYDKRKVIDETACDKVRARLAELDRSKR